MAQLDVSQRLTSQPDSYSYPQPLDQQPESTGPISFLQLPQANDQVGYQGDLFLSDPEFRKKWLTFAKKKCSPPQFELIRQLVEHPQESFADPDRKVLTQLVACLFTENNDLGAWFNAADQTVIRSFMEKLEATIYTAEEDAKSVRKKIETQWGMTPDEVDFRSRTYLVDPDAQSVDALVDEWISKGVITMSGDLKTIATQVTQEVKKKIAYREDEVGANGEPKDHWQSVDETLRLGVGDCEDTSILVASTLMNILQRQQLAPADIRDMVQLSAGYMAGEDQVMGHMVVRVQSGALDLACDTTQTTVIQPFSALNMKVVFEFNDRRFKAYQPIDSGFATALNVTGIKDPNSIAHMIQTRVETLNKLLRKKITLPAVQDGKVIDPRNNAEIISKEYDFFNVEKHHVSLEPVLGNPTVYEYWTFELDSTAFQDYINQTRDKVNMILMLLNVGNALIEARNKESRSIYDQQLSQSERNEINQSRRSADQHSQKFMQKFNQFQQRQASAVQELTQELFQYVQKNNDAQFMDVKYRIELWLREDPLVGIGTAIMDQATHHLTVRRAKALVEMSKVEAQITQKNISVYNSIARDMGERVELWDTQPTKTKFDVPFFDKNIQKVLEGGATTRSLRKATTLEFIGNIQAQLNKVDRAVDGMTGLGTTQDYYMLNQSGLTSTEKTGRDQLLNENNMFDRAGPKGQYLDINTQQVVEFRDYLVKYQNHVRAYYMMTMALWDMKRQVAADIGGKSESSSVSMAQRSVQGAISTELSKQSTFVNQVTGQLGDYVSKINDLVGKAGQHYKDQKLEEYKGGRLGGMVAASLLAEAMAFGASASATASIVFAPMAMNIYQTVSRAMTEVFNATNQLIYDKLALELEKELQEFPEIETIQEQREHAFSFDINQARRNKAEQTANAYKNQAFQLFSSGQSKWLTGVVEKDILKARAYMDHSEPIQVTDGSGERLYEAPSMGIMGANRSYLLPKGQGGVEIDQALIASTQEQIVFFQKKINFYLTVMKALYEAAEQAIATMTGKNKGDTLSKWDDQIGALLSNESALMQSYETDLQLTIQAISQSQGQHERVFRQNLEWLFSIGQGAIAAITAYMVIPMAWFVPNSDMVHATMQGLLSGALDLTKSGLSSWELAYAKMKTNLALRGSDQGYSVYTTGREAAYNNPLSEEQKIKKRENIFIEESAQDWLNEFQTVTQSAIDELNPFSDNKLNKGNISRMARRFKMENHTEKDAFDIARRGVFEKGLLEEKMHIQTFMNNNSIAANSPLSFLPDQPYAKIDYNQVSETLDKLNRVFMRRNILLAIEQALYQQRKNVLQKMFGVRLSSGLLDSIVEYVEEYNQSQLTAFDKLVAECKIRVDAHNEWFLGEANFVMDASVSATTFLLHLASASFAYKFMHVKPEMYRRLAKRINRTVTSVASAGFGVKMWYGLALISSTRTSSKYAVNHFKDDDDEPIEEDQQEEYDQHTKSTSFGTQRISQGHLAKSQVKIKRRYRQKRIMAEVLASIANAKADVSDSISGNTSSRAGTNGVTKTISNFERTAIKVAQNQFQKAKEVAEAKNRGLEIARSGAMGLASKVIAYGVTKLKKWKKKKKEKADKKAQNSPGKVTKQEKAKAEGTTLKTAKKSDGSRANLEKNRVTNKDMVNQTGPMSRGAHTAADFAIRMADVGTIALSNLLSDLVVMVATADPEHSIDKYGKASEQLEADVSDMELEEDAHQSNNDWEFTDTEALENTMLMLDERTKRQQLSIEQIRKEAGAYGQVGDSYANRIIQAVKKSLTSHYQNTAKNRQERELAGLGSSKGRGSEFSTVSRLLSLFTGTPYYLGKMIGDRQSKNAAHHVIKRAAKIKKASQKGEFKHIDNKNLYRELSNENLMTKSGDTYRARIGDTEKKYTIDTMADAYYDIKTHQFSKSGIEEEKNRLIRKSRVDMINTLNQKIINQTSAGEAASVLKKQKNILELNNYLDDIEGSLIKITDLVAKSPKNKELKKQRKALIKSHSKLVNQVNSHRDVRKEDFMIQGINESDAKDLLKIVASHFGAKVQNGIRVRLITNKLNDLNRADKALEKKYGKESTAYKRYKKAIEKVVTKRRIQIGRNTEIDPRIVQRMRSAGYIDQFGRIKGKIDQVSKADLATRLIALKSHEKETALRYILAESLEHQTHQQVMERAAGQINTWKEHEKQKKKTAATQIRKITNALNGDGVPTESYTIGVRDTLLEGRKQERDTDVEGRIPLIVSHVNIQDGSRKDIKLWINPENLDDTLSQIQEKNHVKGIGSIDFKVSDDDETFVRLKQATKPKDQTFVDAFKTEIKEMAKTYLQFSQQMAVDQTLNQLQKRQLSRYKVTASDMNEQPNTPNYRTATIKAMGKKLKAFSSPAGYVRFDQVRKKLGLEDESLINGLQDALLEASPNPHTTEAAFIGEILNKVNDQRRAANKSEWERPEAQQVWSKIGQVIQGADTNETIAALRLLFGIANNTHIQHLQKQLKTNETDASHFKGNMEKILGEKLQFGFERSPLAKIQEDRIADFREKLSETSVSLEALADKDGGVGFNIRAILMDPSGKGGTLAERMLFRAPARVLLSGLETLGLATSIDYGNEEVVGARRAESRGLNRGLAVKRTVAALDEIYPNIGDYHAKKYGARSFVNKWVKELELEEKKIESAYRTVKESSWFGVEREAGFEKSKEAQKDVLKVEQNAALQIGIWLESDDVKKATSCLIELGKSEVGARLAGRVLQTLAASEEDNKLHHRVMNGLLEQANEESETSAAVLTILNQANQNQKRVSGAHGDKRMMGKTYNIDNKFSSYGMTFNSDDEAKLKHSQSLDQFLKQPEKFAKIWKIAHETSSSPTQLHVANDLARYFSDDNRTNMLAYLNDEAIPLEERAAFVAKLRDMNSDELPFINGDVIENEDMLTHYKAIMDDGLMVTQSTWNELSRSANRLIPNIELEGQDLTNPEWIQEARKHAISTTDGKDQVGHMIGFLGDKFKDLSGSDEAIAEVKLLVNTFLNEMNADSVSALIEVLAEVFDRFPGNQEQKNNLLADVAEKVVGQKKDAIWTSGLNRMVQIKSDFRPDHRREKAIIQTLTQSIDQKRQAAHPSSPSVQLSDILKRLILASQGLEEHDLTGQNLDQLAKVIVVGTDQHTKLGMNLLKKTIEKMALKTHKERANQLQQALSNAYRQLDADGMNLNKVGSLAELKLIFEGETEHEKAFKMALDEGYQAQPFVAPLVMHKQGRDIQQVAQKIEELRGTRRGGLGGDRLGIHVLDMVKQDPKTTAIMISELQRVQPTLAHDMVEATLKSIREASALQVGQGKQFLEALWIKMHKSKQSEIGEGAQQIELGQIQEELEAQQLLDKDVRDQKIGTEQLELSGLFKALTDSKKALVYSDSFYPSPTNGTLFLTHREDLIRTLIREHASEDSRLARAAEQTPLNTDQIFNQCEREDESVPLKHIQHLCGLWSRKPRNKRESLLYWHQQLPSAEDKRLLLKTLLPEQPELDALLKEFTHHECSILVEWAHGIESSDDPRQHLLYERVYQLLSSEDGDINVDEQSQLAETFQSDEKVAFIQKKFDERLSSATDPEEALPLIEEQLEVDEKISTWIGEKPKKHNMAKVFELFFPTEHQAQAMGDGATYREMMNHALDTLYKEKRLRIRDWEEKQTPHEKLGAIARKLSQSQVVCLKSLMNGVKLEEKYEQLDTLNKNLAKKGNAQEPSETWEEWVTIVDREEIARNPIIQHKYPMLALLNRIEHHQEDHGDRMLAQRLGFHPQPGLPKDTGAVSFEQYFFEDRLQHGAPQGPDPEDLKACLIYMLGAIEKGVSIDNEITGLRAIYERLTRGMTDHSEKIGVADSFFKTIEDILLMDPDVQTLEGISIASKQTMMQTLRKTTDHLYRDTHVDGFNTGLVQQTRAIYNKVKNKTLTKQDTNMLAGFLMGYREQWINEMPDLNIYELMDDMITAKEPVEQLTLIMDLLSNVHKKREQKGIRDLVTTTINGSMGVLWRSCFLGLAHYQQPKPEVWLKMIKHHQSFRGERGEIERWIHQDLITRTPDLDTIPVCLINWDRVWESLDENAGKTLTHAFMQSMSVEQEDEARLSINLCLLSNREAEIIEMLEPSEPGAVENICSQLDQLNTDADLNGFASCYQSPYVCGAVSRWIQKHSPLSQSSEQAIHTWCRENPGHLNIERLYEIELQMANGLAERSSKREITPVTIQLLAPYEIQQYTQKLAKSSSEWTRNDWRILASLVSNANLQAQLTEQLKNDPKFQEKFMAEAMEYIHRMPRELEKWLVRQPLNWSPDRLSVMGETNREFLISGVKKNPEWLHKVSPQHIKEVMQEILIDPDCFEHLPHILNHPYYYERGGRRPEYFEPAIQQAMIYIAKFPSKIQYVLDALTKGDTAITSDHRRGAQQRDLREAVVDCLMIENSPMMNPLSAKHHIIKRLERKIESWGYPIDEIKPQAQNPVWQEYWHETGQNPTRVNEHVFIQELIDKDDHGPLIEQLRGNEQLKNEFIQKLREPGPFMEIISKGKGPQLEQVIQEIGDELTTEDRRQLLSEIQFWKRVTESKNPIQDLSRRYANKSVLHFMEYFKQASIENKKLIIDKMQTKEIDVARFRGDNAHQVVAQLEVFNQHIDQTQTILDKLLTEELTDIDKIQLKDAVENPITAIHMMTHITVGMNKHNIGKILDLVDYIEATLSRHHEPTVKIGLEKCRMAVETNRLEGLKEARSQQDGDAVIRLMKKGQTSVAVKQFCRQKETQNNWADWIKTCSDDSFRDIMDMMTTIEGDERLLPAEGVEQFIRRVIEWDRSGPNFDEDRQKLTTTSLKLLKAYQHHPKLGKWSIRYSLQNQKLGHAFLPKYTRLMKDLSASWLNKDDKLFEACLESEYLDLEDELIRNNNLTAEKMISRLSEPDGDTLANNEDKMKNFNRMMKKLYQVKGQSSFTKELNKVLDIRGQEPVKEGLKKWLENPDKTVLIAADKVQNPCQLLNEIKQKGAYQAKKEIEKMDQKTIRRSSAARLLGAVNDETLDLQELLEKIKKPSKEMSRLCEKVIKEFEAHPSDNLEILNRQRVFALAAMTCQEDLRLSTPVEGVDYTRKITYQEKIRRLAFPLPKQDKDRLIRGFESALQREEGLEYLMGIASLDDSKKTAYFKILEEKTGLNKGYLTYALAKKTPGWQDRCKRFNAQVLGTELEITQDQSENWLIGDGHLRLKLTDFMALKAYYTQPTDQLDLDEAVESLPQDQKDSVKKYLQIYDELYVAIHSETPKAAIRSLMNRLKRDRNSLTIIKEILNSDPEIKRKIESRYDISAEDRTRQRLNRVIMNRDSVPAEVLLAILTHAA